MAGGDPTGWKAKGMEGIEGRFELEEKRLLELRAALQGRTGLGTAARDCHVPLHTARLPIPSAATQCPSGPAGTIARLHGPSGRKPGLPSGSFCSTGKSSPLAFALAIPSF